jgi:preprotein translocase subunit SecA
MTGTAATEAEELHKIYNLDVVVIPTNEPMVRVDHPDRIYRTEEVKFRAVVREIEEFYKRGCPVLVGTVSIEKSEDLSDLLRRRGIPHQVLNAKHHEKEAGIIAQAGRPGAVTIATNMAGRGVDIVLGGNPAGRDEREWEEQHNKVVELGGLHIIGTERHEARRIDNQLRGRAGRQGDPGSSCFYVSLEDDIIRWFGGDRIKGFMGWAGLDDDTPIEHSLVNKAIESTQTRVEGYHFDTRKHLVEYDDVVNKHREVIYGERKKILSDTDLRSNILSMVRQEIQRLVDTHFTEGYEEGWNAEGLVAELNSIFSLPPEMNAAVLSGMSRGEVEKKLIQHAEALYQDRERELEAENMRMLERVVMLRIVDSLWIEHLTVMENMRQGIGLRAVGHSDPLMVYKTEGHAMFQNLLDSIQHDVVHTIYHVGIVKQGAQRPMAQAQAAASAGGGGRRQPVRAGRKVGRNDPCPCGSGKKYKYCCGR